MFCSFHFVVIFRNEFFKQVFTNCRIFTGERQSREVNELKENIKEYSFYRRLEKLWKWFCIQVP